jgi:hypothetical protein
MSNQTEQEYRNYIKSIAIYYNEHKELTAEMIADGYSVQVDGPNGIDRIVDSTGRVITTIREQVVL